MSGKGLWTRQSTGEAHRSKTHREVSALHSLTSIQNYVHNIPTDAPVVAGEPESGVPYADIDDFA